MDDFTLGDNITRIKPFEIDFRKQDMRRRGADIDANCLEDNFIFLNQAAFGTGKKNAAASSFIRRHDCKCFRPQLL